MSDNQLVQALHDALPQLAAEAQEALDRYAAAAAQLAEAEARLAQWN